MKDKFSWGFLTLLAFGIWWFAGSGSLRNDFSTDPSEVEANSNIDAARAIASQDKDITVPLMLQKIDPDERRGIRNFGTGTSFRERLLASREKRRAPMGRMTVPTQSPAMARQLRPFLSATSQLAGMQLWSGVRAYADLKNVPEGAQIVYKGSQIWVVQEGESADAPDGVFFDAHSSPVFVSERDHKTRVPNGRLMIKAKNVNRGEISALVRDYGFEKIGEMASVKIVEVKLAETSDLVKVLDQLGKDPRVESIEIEYYRTPPQLK